MRKVLIVGGDASMCDGVITYLENNNYEIDTLTYRDHNKINDRYNWKYLDLMSQESIESFLDSLPDEHYDDILLTPTYNSGTKNVFETTREYLFDVYGIFTINYMILIRSLFKKITPNGHIIYISSESANLPVDYVDYSAAKGAMQTYVRSLSKKTIKDQAIFSIAPGLIYESSAYFSGNPDNNPETLTTKEQIAEIIVEADKSYNGKIICIGYVPATLDIK